MPLIKFFRRYNRWNPVHPVLGAFWGFGVGVGCGVGWGPGYGPEAVGFVGSGCGVGFNVGFMMIGAGLGLPAGGLIGLPWNGLVWSGKRASHVTSAVVLPALLCTAAQGWEAASSQAAAFERSCQKMYDAQMPKGRQFLAESRQRLTKHIGDSGSSKAVITEERKPLDNTQQSEDLQRKPRQSFSATASSEGDPNARARGRTDFLPPASREGQSRESRRSSQRKT